MILIRPAQERKHFFFFSRNENQVFENKKSWVLLGRCSYRELGCTEREREMGLKKKKRESERKKSK